MKPDMTVLADFEGRNGNMIMGVVDDRLEDCRLANCDSGRQGRRIAAAESGPKKEYESKRVSVGLLYRDSRRDESVSLENCERGGVGIRWWMGAFEVSCNGD